MKYSLTQKLSHEELWKSWEPTRTEDEDGCSLIAYTSMGLLTSTARSVRVPTQISGV